MRQLRNSIIVLLIFGGITLNIERFDLGSGIDIINIQSFFYILLGAAILLTLAIPNFKKIPLSGQLIGWLGIYLVCKLLIFTDRPFLGGLYTYLSVTEMALLLIGVLLTNRVTDALFNLENIVSNISLTDVSSRVMGAETAADDIAREFVRSRRHKLPLSVLLVKLDPAAAQSMRENAMQEIVLSLMARYTANSLVRVLDRALRRTDLIIEQHDSSRIVLLLPETDAGGSQVMAERIEALSQEQLGVPVTCGHATFPDEAVTFDELVQRAAAQYDTPAAHFVDSAAEAIEQGSERKFSEVVE